MDRIWLAVFCINVACSSGEPTEGTDVPLELRERAKAYEDRKLTCLSKPGRDEYLECLGEK